MGLKEIPGGLELGMGNTLRCNYGHEGSKKKRIDGFQQVIANT